MRQAPIFVAALALAIGVGTQACGRDGSPDQEIITLTGCLQPGVDPGVYNLMSVATAGVIEHGPGVPAGTDGTQDSPDWTADDASTRTSSAQLAATSSYRLIAGTADERREIAQYENQRVTVRGRLASEVPVGTTGTNEDIPRQGVVVESSPTNAEVVGAAPPLRGFHVESVTKVADSCYAR